MKNKPNIFEIAKMSEREIYFGIKNGQITLSNFRIWYQFNSNSKGFKMLLESGLKPPKASDGFIVDYI